MKRSKYFEKFFFLLFAGMLISPIQSCDKDEEDEKMDETNQNDKEDEKMDEPNQNDKEDEITKFFMDEISYTIVSESDQTVEISSRYPIKGMQQAYVKDSIMIPEMVTYNGNTYSVIGIGDYAFSYSRNLIFISIPESVTSIGDYAFNGCSSLASVTIPESVTSIGGYAFKGCSSLASVIIGNSVTSIGDYAFNGCSSLESVTIPESVTSIGDKAFYNCSSLESVTIPESVTSIGDWVFNGCSGLTSIVINSATSIGNWGLRNCSSLASVIIGNSVTSIGDYAFYNCSSLESVTIGNSVTSIGDYAFYKCSSLESVTIPESVTSIGGSVFSGCSSLASVIIGNSVTSIGDYAFYNCSSLESVIIGNSVTSIGFNAFGNCSDLTAVHLTDLEAWYSNIVFHDPNSNPLYYAHHLYLNGEEVKDLVIPNSVTNIGDYAFYGCTSLASITIPESVTNIGDCAFYGCSSLTSITLPESIIDIGENVFTHTGWWESQGNFLLYLYLDNHFLGIDINPKEEGDMAGFSTFKTDLNIKEGTKIIVKNALKGFMSYINSITIPESVTNIGSGAFSYENYGEYDDYYLTSITVKAKTPPVAVDQSSFEGCYSVKLLVPKGTLAAYRSATEWKNFTNIEEF